MTLFHGTNADFDKVSLEFAKDKRDFGRGFYTTTIKEQAEEWAESICRRQRTGAAYLYEFTFSPDGLKIQFFNGITREWLDFVIENRIKGGIRHPFDIVTGPVANDQTMDTIGFFLSGIYSPEEALRRLEYRKTNDQVSLHTGKAVSCLQFVRKYKWNV